jgi:signal transduction histidine kinase
MNAMLRRATLLLLPAAGGFVAVLGLAVMLAWQLGKSTLIQIWPNLVPMQFNTALGFFLCGLGIFFVGLKWRRSAVLCGAAASTLGLLSLAQYLFGADFGIDRLFIDPWLTVKTVHPGRMAQTTALGFILLGAALLLNLFRISYQVHLLVTMLLAVSVVDLAGISFFGYLSGSEVNYGWGHLTRMALHTSVAFLVLGTALLIMPLRIGNAGNLTIRLLQGPLACGVSVIALTTIIWLGLVKQESFQIKRAVDTQAATIENNIRINLEMRVKSLIRMAERFEKKQEKWLADAELYLTHQKGYQAIAWVDPSYRARWIAQASSGGAPLAQQLTHDRDIRLVFKAAKESGGPLLSATINSEVMGNGFFIAVPIFHNPGFSGPEFLGLIIGILDYKQFFSAMIKSHADGYAVLIHGEKGEKIYGAYDPTRPKEIERASIQRIKVRNASWRLDLWPSNEQLDSMRSPFPELVLFSGFVMSLLFSLSVHFAQTLHRRRERILVINRRLEKEVCERKRTEKALATAKERAEAANQAKSEFLANMSHELRTPLNAILGFSEIMKDEMLGPLSSAKYSNYAQDIHESGAHLLGIINDILNLSQIEAGKLILEEREIDIKAVVHSVLRIIQPQAEETGVGLSYDIEPAIGLLKADRRQVKQILINLLSNAIKFTPKGGAVTLSCQTEADGGISFIVSDNGIGMSKDEVAKALELFGQIEVSDTREHEGTGLGLPLSDSLIKLHGGSLIIDSEKDRGTTVTVAFPPVRSIRSAA